MARRSADDAHRPKKIVQVSTVVPDRSVPDHSHRVGRPPKYETVEELEALIEQYFIQMDEEDRPYTITGLAVALGTDRSTLIEYAGKEKFSYTIKSAKAKIENYTNEAMLSNKLNTVGSIFNLKNNYGWKDQTHTDLTSKDEKIEGLTVFKPSVPNE